MVNWSPDLQQALRVELAPGERVEWQGQPDPIVGAASEWPALPFGGFWLAMCAYGFHKEVWDGNLMPAIMAAVFTVIGAWIMTRPVAEYGKQRHTAFAITDRRLIVLRKNGRSITSVLCRGIRQIERVRKWRGITLRIPTQMVSDGDGGRTVDHIVMHGLRDGDAAYRLLMRTTNGVL